MEKRALIAVVLSIAVFYLFSAYLGPKQIPTAPVASSTDVKAAQPVAEKIVPTAVAAPVATAVTAQDVKVETERFTAVFSGAGGALKSLTLKGYRENNRPDSPRVSLAAHSDPALLTFSTAGVGFMLQPQALYAPSTSSLSLAKDEKKQLVFTHISAQGYVVRKTFSFTGDGYGIQLETQLINNSPAPIVGSFQQIITAPFDVNTKEGRYETYGFTLFADNSLHTNAPKDVVGSTKKYEKSILWSGITDKYFLTALLAEQGSIAAVEIKKNQAGYLESISSSPGFTVASGQAISVQYRLFVGPKDIDILKAQGASLEQSLDLGWFTMLAKPMLHALKFFYGYIPNFGIGIIIITVILKIVFFPLTHKSYKSMKDMSKLQPKMAALKEKFKNDKDGLNKAVMEMYREHKVNPLGGCLPMIVQIPVFFALYKALMFSIELRHAPFMLWITDLSDKDPYYITPLLMGVTMFIQQKMTPSNMDEMQQKVMLALPVVFTFMFLTFPSGLVLYWLINNILTIGQQMYINKLVKD